MILLSSPCREASAARPPSVSHSALPVESVHMHPEPELLSIPSLKFFPLACNPCFPEEPNFSPLDMYIFSNQRFLSLAHPSVLALYLLMYYHRISDMRFVSCRHLLHLSCIYGIQTLSVLSTIDTLMFPACQSFASSK